jgi:uridine kinase
VDHEAANRILTNALEVGPRCGSVVLIGIDGRSGAGKTTLAGLIAELAEQRGLRTTTIHNDELCPGWDGLPEVPKRLGEIARQLAIASAATYPTWDWYAHAAGPEGLIPPSDLVILEGVASIDPAWAALRSVSVWVDAPANLRKERAIGRDGEGFAAHWDQWAAAEDRYYATAPPNPDLVVEVR